ncbi:LTA synthase family protein [Bacillus luteolus]|uniref:LTA synthase family protein n=1 Tax=Litchfieldia luteola TaxID=682179 RepID=A0ABR9QEK7_9BACI|nr:LTA synthase family protein [Cytobacillus luteolus]MBE4906856.1 LTA synthase family protein [Cytobacillus luteolus]MBP1940489.1 phosphoglycerol transferase MdoB-like AlkP superfamily enzyme [Cytobacillus luteolus]
MNRLFSKVPLIWLSILLLTLKTYIVTKLVFELDIDSFSQELILALSALCSSVILLGLALFGKKQHQFIKIMFLYSFATIILYINVLYYRFFNDFITIPVLFQSKNLSDLWTSLVELNSLFDLFIFLDIVILAMLYKRKQERVEMTINKKKFMVVTCVLIFISLVYAHAERPELLTRSFDRKLLVKNLGVYAYQGYDFLLYSNTKRRIAFADSDKLTEIVNYVNANKEKPNEDLFGKAKGKNLFLISLESTQDFVVNREIDGQEITPFLNQLIKEKGSYYFSNFYHQTGQGKTSDSEFIVENSLYGLPRGAVFFSNPQNKYQSLTNYLKDEKGYYTSVFHANNKSFWNRDVMYEAIGYDRFFSDLDYWITEENSIGWGLKDDHFFTQSIPHLKQLPQPFMAKFITLTNHFPFSLSQQDEIIPEWNSKDGTVNRYFTTVSYQDAALRKFFEQLKAAGLYENSIFVIYGDHYGISDNHNTAMSQFLNTTITPYEYIELQKVPLIFHFPKSHETKTITSVTGQIDLKPTILNLMGISEKSDIQFGSDLFSEEKKDNVIMRDGSVVTNTYVATGNKCYLKETGQEIPSAECMPLLLKAKKELSYSDRVIYGDLLKFLPSYYEGTDK